MERELFRSLYIRVRSIGRHQGNARLTHTDWKIVMVFFWAVLHDRPVCWACSRTNWPSRVGDLCLPSASTMSRRLRRDSVIALIDAVEKSLQDAQQSDQPIGLIDSKPLPIGSGTKDPDARAGFAGCGIAKGYKLHAICDTRRIPVVWCVRPMNENDAPVALQLIGRLAPRRYGRIVGDNAYDKNVVYDTAGERGWQMYAPRRQGEGLGHRVHSPYRLMAQCARSDEWKEELEQARIDVERFFAHLTSGHLGLQRLPSWVRRHHRVRRWVQAKIIIYLAAKHLRNHRMTA